jgi:hypothetical protein
MRSDRRIQLTITGSRIISGTGIIKGGRGSGISISYLVLRNGVGWVSWNLPRGDVGDTVGMRIRDLLLSYLMLVIRHWVL